MHYWILIAVLVLSGCVSRSSDRQDDDNDNDNGSDYTEYDVWFGPGFYYGVWFDDEDD